MGTQTAQQAYAGSYLLNKPRPKKQTVVLQSYKSSVCAPCAVLAQTVPGRERGSSVNRSHISSPLPQPSAGAGQAREASSLGVSQAETPEHQTHSSGWHLGAQRPGASQRGPGGSRGAGGSRAGPAPGPATRGPLASLGSAASGLVTESNSFT